MLPMACSVAEQAEGAELRDLGSRAFRLEAKG